MEALLRRTTHRRVSHTCPVAHAAVVEHVARLLTREIITNRARVSGSSRRLGHRLQPDDFRYLTSAFATAAVNGVVVPRVPYGTLPRFVN